MFKDVVIANAKALATADNSSKGVFNTVIGLCKEAKVQNIAPVQKNLVAEAKEVLGTDYTNNVVNRIIKAIKLACKWYDKKLFTKHEYLTYSNIELGLRVLDALEQLEDSDALVKKVRNQLNRIKLNGNDTVSYNNDFELKLQELMKEYNLADVDGQITSMEKRLEKLFLLMNDEQKQGFLEFVNNNCKVDEAKGE